MDALNSLKRLLILILPVLFFNTTVYSELSEELRKEVITFIRVGYLEFPEHESGALPIGSVTINSTELSDAFTQYGVQTIQRGFPEFTDDDTIRTSETGYTFLIPQFSRIFRLQLNSEENVEGLINQISEMHDVIGYAEKNSDLELCQEIIPNDYLFSSQWHLKNTGSLGGTPGADIKATFAWMLFKGNPQVKVGVFDTGVDQLHPDLSGRISGEGYHTFWNVCYYSHGTHVAGLIGARTNNNTGVAGVDWNCQLVSYEIFRAGSQIGDAEVANKIIQAVNSGVRVLNHSWGGPAPISVTLQLAFIYAHKMNKVSVAAMGNGATSYPFWPAAFQDLPIAVGGTDWDDNLASRYSNYGPSARVVAPGGYYEFPCPESYSDPKDILSTWPNNNYVHISGTSMATPLVSGLASLITGSRQRTLYNDDIKNLIYISVDDRGDPGWDEYYGYGRINCRRALEFAGSPYTFTYLTTSGSGTTVTWEGQFTFIPWSISGLENGRLYRSMKYRVKKQINVGSNINVWGRGNQTTGYNGYSHQQHGMGYTYASKINETTAELQTFVYNVFDGQPPFTLEFGWFPCQSIDVLYAYTLHGINRFYNYQNEDRQQVGGCPWLFVYNVPDSAWYIGDNNILHRSEISELSGQDITDVYKLNVAPNLTSESEFSLKIIETEKDYGFIDKVSFKAVDHPEGTTLGVTENNDVVIYDVGDRSSSHNAELNNVNNITRYIRYEYGGNQQVKGDASDSVNVADFEDSGLPAGDSLALILSVSNNPQLYTDDQVKEYAGEVSMYLNSSPLPLTKKFARRENKSVIIIPIAEVDATVDSAIIKWYRDYDLDYLFVSPISYTGYTVTEIPLIAAIQTVDGDVSSKLSNIDANYANIDSISMITLSYSNISPPQSGLVRDYIFETTGRYEKNQGEGDNMLAVKDKNNNVPLENRLYNNYPNPFNPKTSIKFSVKTDRWVKIVIYDILGRVVNTLLNEFKQKGSYTIDFIGSNYASGVYFYRIEAGDFVQSKKMVLIK